MVLKLGFAAFLFHWPGPCRKGSRFLRGHTRWGMPYAPRIDCHVLAASVRWYTESADKSFFRHPLPESSWAELGLNFLNLCASECHKHLISYLVKKEIVKQMKWFVK